MNFAPGKPRFEHDCLRCLFLGRYVAENGAQGADVYFCPDSTSYGGIGDGGSVLMRYSSDGPDYGSGDIITILGRSHRDSLLLDAAREILDRGLVKLVLDETACAKLRADNEEG